jgi:DNA-binding NarL/FixJ family response regulator
VKDNMQLARSEMKLLSLLAQGLNNHEIASVLGNQEQDVVASIADLMVKTGAGDRFELAMFGVAQSQAGPGDAQEP